MSDGTFYKSDHSDVLAVCAEHGWELSPLVTDPQPAPPSPGSRETGK